MSEISTNNVQSKNPELFKYVRDLLPDPTHVKLQTKDYIVVASKTLRIYDTKKFSLIFEGPRLLSPIDFVECPNGKLYLISGNELTEIYRGDVVKKYFVTKDEITSNDVNIKSDLDTVQAPATTLRVRQILSVNEFTLLLINDTILITENFTNLTKIESNNVELILHPLCYPNKILIVKKDEIDLVNIKSKKIIFTFKLENIKIGASTPFSDIVALANDTKIIFFNLKTNEIAWSVDLKGVKSISVGEEYFLCTDEEFKLHIFDIKRMLKIKEMENCIFAEILEKMGDTLHSNTTFIACTDGLELHEIKDNTVNQIHRRLINFRTKKMSIHKNKLVLLGEDKVVIFNPLKDDQTFYFKDLREMKNIFGNLVGSDTKLCILNLDGKPGAKRKIVQSTKFDMGNLSYDEPFYVYGRDKINLCNVQSEKVLRVINEETNRPSSYLPVLLVHNFTIFASNNTNVAIFDFNGTKTRTLNISGVKKMKSHENFVSILTENKIYILEDFNIIREIKVCCVEYALSEDLKWVGCVEKDSLSIFDIPSGNRIFSKKFENCAEILFLGDFMFVLMKDGSISQFYNNSLFEESLLEMKGAEYEEEEIEDICLDVIAFMEYGKKIKSYENK